MDTAQGDGFPTPAEIMARKPLTDGVGHKHYFLKVREIERWDESETWSTTEIQYACSCGEKVLP